MELENKQRKKALSCGACVYRIHNDNVEVLLVKPFKTRPAWGIPKGHIDKEELPEDCAVREVFEETGISISLEDRLPDAVTSYRDTDKTVMSWLGKQECNVVPHPSDGENCEVRWFSIDKLPHLHRYQTALLQAAVDILRKKTSVAA